MGHKTYIKLKLTLVTCNAVTKYISIIRPLFLNITLTLIMFKIYLVTAIITDHARTQNHNSVTISSKKLTENILNTY
jgi:hypothetical protein